MYSECQGCKFHTVNYPAYCMFGLIPHIENTDGCPCRTCLVKGMCGERLKAVALKRVCGSTCEDFSSYVYQSRCLKSFHEVMKYFASTKED